MREKFTFVWCVILMATLTLVATAEVEDVVHLDLSVPRDTSEIVINWPSDIFQGNDSKIYCTFPGDVYCDLRSLERKKHFKHQPVTTKAYLIFTHPNFTEVVGFAKFENADEGSPSRLVFRYFSAYALPNITKDDWVRTIERRLREYEVAETQSPTIPDVLPVGDAVALEFHDRSTENLSFKCRRRFKRVQEDSGETSRPTLVAFQMDSMACISSSPPILRVSNGATMEKAVNQTTD